MKRYEPSILYPYETPTMVESPNGGYILIDDLQKVIDLLKEHADKNLHEEWFDDPDFVIDDLAGGNVDDAFYSGSDYGACCLAQEVLAIMECENVQ